MKNENSCLIPEKSKYKKPSRWCRVVFKLDPEGKGPMNSVLSVSPFVRSIFFLRMHSTVFPNFLHLGDNMGQTMTYTEFFKKHLDLLKIRKWSQMRFFGISSKMALRIFLIFRSEC